MADGPAATTPGDRPLEAEATPTLCLYCGAPIEPAKRGGTRRFCNSRHRVAYRTAQIQAAITQALAAVDETSGELERLAARLEGARQLLQRFQRQLPRPAHPDTESTKTTRDDLTPQTPGPTLGSS